MATKWPAPPRRHYKPMSSNIKDWLGVCAGFLLFFTGAFWIYMFTDWILTCRY